jgi:hypothetical protein
MLSQRHYADSNGPQVCYNASEAIISLRLRSCSLVALDDYMISPYQAEILHSVFSQILSHLSSIQTKNVLGNFSTHTWNCKVIFTEWKM